MTAISDLHEYKETAGSCSACGNSPINHTSSWLMQSIDVIISRLNHRLARNDTFVAAQTMVRRAIVTLSSLHYFISRALGIVTLNNDIAKATTYRSQVIWEEAERRGIKMQQAAVYRKPIDTYRALVNGKWLYFESLPIPSWLEQRGYLWIDDKYLLSQELLRARIAAPESYSVTNVTAALQAFSALGSPVIIKPQVGSRGRHTTTFVTSTQDLVAAFMSAKQLCHRVTVQRQLLGSVCRATVVAGELVGFFEAKPPRVLGDGVSTIKSLVEKKNAMRHERVQAVVLTLEHEAFLKRQGYTYDSIPVFGVSIDLTHRTGRLFGGETRELLAFVHPVLKKQILHAALLLQVPVVGFDVIIFDPEKDPNMQKWGIIEANSLPFIDLHYLPLYGEPSNVARSVWDLWGEGAQKKMPHVSIDRFPRSQIL